MPRRLEIARQQARTDFADFAADVLLPVAETAAVIGCSQSWLKSDRLAHHRTGSPLRGPRPTVTAAGGVRYAVQDVRDWIAAQRAGGAVVVASERGGPRGGGRPSKHVGRRTSTPANARAEI